MLKNNFANITKSFETQKKNVVRHDENTDEPNYCSLM